MMSLIVLLVGCDATLTVNRNNPESNEVESAPADLAVAADPSPSPSPVMTNTSCWNNQVKKNGAAYAAYPTASRAAGNTWYDCTGSGSIGGIWIAFYDDGTLYWGGLAPGFVFTDPGVNNSDCSRFEFKNSSGEVYGYATDATLASDGTLLTITLTKWVSASDHTYFTPETLSCSVYF